MFAGLTFPRPWGYVSFAPDCNSFDARVYRILLILLVSTENVFGKGLRLAKINYQGWFICYRD